MSTKQRREPDDCSSIAQAAPPNANSSEPHSGSMTVAPVASMSPTRELIRTLAIGRPSTHSSVNGPAASNRAGTSALPSAPSSASFPTSSNQRTPYCSTYAGRAASSATHAEETRSAQIRSKNSLFMRILLYRLGKSPC